MTFRLFIKTGVEILFEELNRNRYRGLLLAANTVNESKIEQGKITVLEYERPIYSLSYRMFEFINAITLNVVDSRYLRLEALLSGEMRIKNNGGEIYLKAGQYQLTDLPLFSALFKKNSACSVFVTYYSPELLQQMNIQIATTGPAMMPPEMSDLIQEMLVATYDEKLRKVYFDHCVQELLSFHIMQGEKGLPNNLSAKDLAAVFKADEIIADNIDEHFSIEQLSRQTGTNTFKLKLGFRKVFGMGIFKRLLFRRMEEAKRLLRTTPLPISEVASGAGYETVAGFIHAFRREVGVTPREWRQFHQSGKSKNK